MVLSSMESELTVGYQDDITHGGSLQTVAVYVRKIAEQGARMAIVLNTSKCELIADSKLVVDCSLLGSFNRVELSRRPNVPGQKRWMKSGRLDAPISLLHVTDSAWLAHKTP